MNAAGYTHGVLLEVMTAPITASMLYNLVQCPKRLDLDLYGSPTLRDQVSPFVQMLWDRGSAYERQVMSSIGIKALDLSNADIDDQEQLTLEAMRRHEPLIYSGRISASDLLGVPDLLRLSGDGYIPIDIKSGAAEESGDDLNDGKPKLHYAVQLGLYVDILERLGLSAGRRGVILDVTGSEVTYYFDEPRGSRKSQTLWDEYQTRLTAARSIVERSTPCLGALASVCKLCHWYTACSAELRKADDLTLIPFLGRTIRDAMQREIATVAELASINPEHFITGKKTVFPRLGPDRLRVFHERAKMLVDPEAKPILTAAIALPTSEVELFFDIEVDPMRDFTYLHGIVERRGGDSDGERFVAFFAEDETPAAEQQAFADAYAFLTADPTVTIWYYSKYERTIYRKLQARYPDVCSPDDIEQLFNPARTIDLYFDVVMKATEWPTNDHSIKTIAKYLGFSWRDNNPSGAASIEWFDHWVRTRDQSVRQRILDYNEDDCRATRVLLDGIRALAND